MNDQSNATQAVGAIMRTNEVVQSAQHETATAAVAARAKAQVEAKYIMAMKNPRDLDVARTKLLHECKRPSFARSARYHKPIGKGVEGPSIRFAEAAVRNLKNIDNETITTYDDEQKSILHVSSTDLESNTSYGQTVVVQKTVERKYLKRGQAALGQRYNNDGELLYIVQATDDEVLNKVNSLVSKALRTLTLRHVPGDIVDECMEMCIIVAEDEDAKDPDAARRAVLDSFFAISVQPQQLVEYLGHSLDTVVPAELAQLRAIYAAIRDGETAWQEVLDNKKGQTADGAAPAKPSQAQSVVDRVKSERGARKSPAKPPAAAAEPKAEPPAAAAPAAAAPAANNKPADPNNDGR
jgi:hypothetical protein